MNASEHTTGDILLVDDNSSNLQTLTTMLSGEGYEIRIAKSGADALQSVRQHPPDLILLDVLMPGMNGHEVCQRLKADAATQDIPVIFVTALAELPEKIKGFEVGGVDYITKPFQAEEVIARVNTHVTMRLLRKKLENNIARLQKTLDEVKTLKGLIPICSSCKKMRDDKGYWNQIEIYMKNHTGAQFSHGICPACIEKLYPDLHEKMVRDKKEDGPGNH